MTNADGHEDAFAHPSADVILFTVDMAHIIDAMGELGFKVKPRTAAKMVLMCRQTEFEIRGMTQRDDAMRDFLDHIKEKGH